MYEQIRKRIVELVPELLELKEGCWIFNEQAIEFDGCVEVDLEGKLIEVNEDKEEVYYLVRYENPYNDEDLQHWLSKEEIQEILGTPPTLQDLLLAIDRTFESPSNFQIDATGYIRLYDSAYYTKKSNGMSGDFEIPRYDLTKSLKENIEQSPEFAEFISNLLK